MAKRKLPPSQRKRTEQPPETILCLSYWPLLGPQVGLTPGVTLAADKANLDRFGKIIADVPEVAVLGCAWTAQGDPENPGPIHPILILQEQAQEVYEHARFWCTERPQEYFLLALAHIPGQYAISLAPNLKASFERLRTNMWFESGIRIPADARFQAFCKPLTVIAPDKLFALIKQRLGTTCDVGFLNQSDLEQLGVDMTPGTSSGMRPAEPAFLDKVRWLQGVPIDTDYWTASLLQQLQQGDF